MHLNHIQMNGYKTQFIDLVNLFDTSHLLMNVWLSSWQVGLPAPLSSAAFVFLLSVFLLCVFFQMLNSLFILPLLSHVGEDENKLGIE